jgi:hypothetical protein
MEPRVPVYQGYFNITSTLSRWLKIVFNERLYAYVSQLLVGVHSWYPWFVCVSYRVAQWVRKCRVTLYRTHAAKSRITAFRKLALLPAGPRSKAKGSVARTGSAHLSELIAIAVCVCKRPDGHWLWLGGTSGVRDFFLRYHVCTGSRVHTVCPE